MSTQIKRMEEIRSSLKNILMTHSLYNLYTLVQILIHSYFKFKLYLYRSHSVNPTGDDNRLELIQERNLLITELSEVEANKNKALSRYYCSPIKPPVLKNKLNNLREYIKTNQPKRQEGFSKLDKLPQRK